MPSDKKPHELHDFMSNATEAMARDYARYQKRVKQDPGTAGDQVEEAWAELLRGWLPPMYHVTTKGRILNHRGEASPQVDVVVLKPSYPRRLQETREKLYLANGVAAAFECKLTFRTRQLEKVLRNAVAIRSLLPRRTGSPYRELHSQIYFGLLAHSHEWKASPKGRSGPDVQMELFQRDGEIVEHPRESLDVVCVADLGIWTCSRHLVAPDERGHFLGYDVSGAGHVVATTGVMSGPGAARGGEEARSPIGALISSLLTRLAWEDSNLRDLAEYFRAVDLMGGGVGYARMWGASIFSEPVKERVLTEQFPLRDSWNEWLARYN